MPIINCPDCSKEMSDAAPACPNCGRPNANAPSQARPVGILLGIGIFLIPLIFSWFTLRKGHTTKARVISFSWLVLSLLIFSAQDGKNAGDESAQQNSSDAAELKKSEPKISPEKVAEEESACSKDLSCWGEKHSISAAVYCEKYVEKLAQYSHEWTDGILEPKFSHYRWKNIDKGVVTYIGDKIKFQNGFGAWQNYVYECDFDPAAETILDVRAQAGRL